MKSTSKLLLSTPLLGDFFFFLGGGGGWSVLENNNVNQEINVTMVTSLIGATTNRNMVEIGLPPSSGPCQVLSGRDS